MAVSLALRPCVSNNPPISGVQRSEAMAPANGARGHRGMAEKARQIGPYSRAPTLVKLDRRTKEARHTEAVIAALTAHVGGNPSATDRVVIERCAWLSLQVAKLDARIATGQFTDHDSRTYAASTSALARMMRSLDAKPAKVEVAKPAKSVEPKPEPPREESLHEYIARAHPDAAESKPEDAVP
jgi:hypothetical protein